MKTISIIQYLPYSYHIHTGGLEKIAQTISDGINHSKDIDFINIASDVRRGPGKELADYNDTIFVSSFDLVHNFPLPKFWKKSFWQHLGDIKKKNPDAIITHTRFFVQSMIGGLIAKRLGCKRIHVEHGSGFVTGYPRYIKLCARLFDRTIGLWIFRQCDQIVTISQMHKSFIKKFTKKEPIVIYNPIDYTPQPVNRNPQLLHIGFIGRLVPLKGVDLLIQALSSIIQHKQRKCTIVGTGSEDEKLKQLTQRLNLADHIAFVGADDRSNRLHTFDIFVNPSHQEGLPTTVVEALMAKCIVVATDVGGTREISDQEDLILVESGKVEEIEKGLLLAFDCLKVSGKSHDKVMERFGVAGAIERYREILLHKNSKGIKEK